jgi:hypothetical protein
MSRDIQAIKISGEDRAKYRDKVRRSLEVFARMLQERLFEANPSQVGVEIELNLVDSRGAPSMCNAPVLDAIADPAWATELGQFNLEINVPPRRLDGGAVADLEAGPRQPNAADAKARRQPPGHVGIPPTLGEGTCTRDPVGQQALPRAQRKICRPRREYAHRDEGAERPHPADSITPGPPASVQLSQVSPDAFARY